jgi:hypothetical protein
MRTKTLIDGLDHKSFSSGEVFGLRSFKSPFSGKGFRVRLKTNV